MAAVVMLFVASPGAIGQDNAQSPARVSKTEGDAYLAVDRLREATEAYLRALATGRDEFTADERVQMAIYISWEDELDTAIEELRLVLDEDPEHLAARAHLARVYAWNGSLDAAIEEAQRVLDREPDNPDALLVKADALEWQGYSGRAIPIYRDVLDATGRFDAALGLSYALLSSGDRMAARESARQLGATTVRQQEQLSELLSAIDQTDQHRLDYRYNYYDDSDQNSYHRNSLAYVFGLRNYDFTLNYTRTHGSSPISRERSSHASFNVRSNLRDGLAMGGGLGVSRPGTTDPPSLLTGEFFVERRISNGEVGFSFSRSVLDDTVELTENRIRRNRWALSGSKPLADRLTVSGSYAYGDFSDGNHSHSLEIQPEYVLMLSPRVTVGYAFRYTDYSAQTQSGFFDPDDYFSNRLVASLYREDGRLYTYASLFIGQQSYSRLGFDTSEFVVGGSGSIGYTPTENISLEFNVDGGNFAGGSITGFDYFVLGPRVWIRF